MVNGKNIWKNNYEKTVELLKNLQNKSINTVINTSCSLLHIPYTLKNEVKLSDTYKKHFSYASEKLVELNEIKKLSKPRIIAIYLNIQQTSNCFPKKEAAAIQM